jgi:phosphohistidine phosphatase SixA
VIYLLRHGDAEDGDGDDGARRLTAKGVARLTGAKAKLRKGGLAILDGGTLMALLRPTDLAAMSD